MTTVPHRATTSPGAGVVEMPGDVEVSDLADPPALAAAFEAERPHLRAVAYRLLGSFADAEDVVQEAWLRLGRVDADRIEDLRAWLAVVVSRLCLDQLRSARGRREGYVGPWLPEPFVDGLTGGGGSGRGVDAGSPVVDAAFVAGAAVPVGPDSASGGRMADPADRVTLAESVSMAMMVVLETLSPAERTAFILHDVFGYEFPEIAVATGRGATSATGRSASTRIRRRVAASPTPSSPRPPAATSTGCWPCSIRTPSSAATAGALRGPPGGRWSAPTGLPGSCSESWPRRPGGPVRIQPIEVNGQPGFASFEGDVLRFIAGLHVAGGRVVEINIVANPEKMRHLSDAALVREAVPVGEPRATNTRR